MQSKHVCKMFLAISQVEMHCIVCPLWLVSPALLYHSLAKL